MVFPTSTNDARRAAGFTLPEFLVAMAIGVLTLGAAVVLWANATKTAAILLNYMELSIASKNALNRISQEVRNARTVRSCSANQLVFVDALGAQTSLTYDSAAQTLTHVKGATTTQLLTGCSFFEFALFQRTPMSGSYDLNTTSQTNLLKVVQMKWTCARKLTGDQQNADNLVSAKVVLRNR